jgi:hypothetical protein
MLNGKFENVTGDVILASAYVTFLAAFNKDYRE